MDRGHDLRTFLVLVLYVSFLGFSYESHGQELGTSTPESSPEIRPEQVLSMDVHTGGTEVLDQNVTLLRGEAAVAALDDYAKNQNKPGQMPYSLFVQADERTPEQMKLDLIQERAKRRAGLQEIPINLAIVTLRTYTASLGYMVFFHDTPAGWIYAAMTTIFVSNMYWSRPDGWHDMQVRRLGEVYDMVGIDQKEMHEHTHWKLNLGVRLSVNVIYGAAVSAFTGFLVAAREKPWFTVLTTILPSGVLNETIDHWSYGNSKPVFTRDQQRLLNAARQIIYSSIVIVAVQKGYTKYGWISLGVGVAAAFGYRYLPQFIELAGKTPLVGSTSRFINKWVLKPLGGNTKYLFDAAGVMFADFYETVMDPIIAKYVEAPRRAVSDAVMDTHTRFNNWRSRSCYLSIVPK